MRKNILILAATVTTIFSVGSVSCRKDNANSNTVQHSALEEQEWRTANDNLKNSRDEFHNAIANLDYSSHSEVTLAYTSLIQKYVDHFDVGVNLKFITSNLQQDLLIKEYNNHIAAVNKLEYIKKENMGELIRDIIASLDPNVPPKTIKNSMDSRINRYQLGDKIKLTEAATAKLIKLTSK